MTTPTIAILQIKTEGPHSFSIEWSDGVTQNFPLFEVQKQCPCASCANRAQPLQIEENLRATQIVNVGKYAIRIHFTTGCNFGIYDYLLLRKIGKRKGNP